ncbi:hypothetical protein SteCoe_6109 [Stentor coeruleus]|uniref:t-SNARE coiled-coil homology domain-containing protein n=1 Tax=Stentor coeruleus TaxID=5963 RepID=A0A1R2CQQ0_9CILI|nr:hypothetical protein SteCoe_6109 [Stentor coeruleus]
MSIQQITRSLGSSRLRTQDFKSIRSEFKKSSQILYSDQKHDLKLQSNNSHINLHEQKQDLLPPEWVDTYDKINEDLSKLDEKMNKLKEVQSERLAIVFGDTTLKDREIEVLINQTTKLIKDTEGFVMNFTKAPGSVEDMNIRKNIQRKLASKLKDITQRQKGYQKIYVEKVQNKPSDDVQQEGGLFDEKEDKFYQIAKVREDGINDLVGNINELAIIFKELSSLILDQGTILDRIDYNLIATKENTKKAVIELQKAEKNQNCTRATSCLLLLIAMIVLLLLILIFKNY